jgi:hypothetical protein
LRLIIESLAAVWALVEGLAAVWALVPGLKGRFTKRSAPKARIMIVVAAGPRADG